MYLRTGNEILEETRALMRDNSSQRWSVVEGQRALNLALGAWSERVWVPVAYEVPGGWVAEQREYVLPDWMPLPITPQFKRAVPGLPYTVTTEREEWADLGYFAIEADGTGRRVLRWEVPPASGPGRILWQYRNTSVPVGATAITVQSDVGSVIHFTNPSLNPLPRMGLVYFPAGGSDEEWVLHTAATSPGSIWRLTRCFAGSAVVAPTHTPGKAAQWGVAAPRMDLFGQLVRQIAANLHELFLHQVSNSSPSARATHQQMVSYYRQQEAEYWSTYSDYTSTPKLRLNRKALYL